MLATIVGMLPEALAWVYIGTTILDFEQSNANPSTNQSYRYLILGIQCTFALLLFLAMFVVGNRIVKTQKLQGEDGIVVETNINLSTSTLTTTPLSTAEDNLRVEEEKTVVDR